ncbi:unnamed protein product [Cuscuta europaea]|uniref:Uncharacterized protein n=1 Tax=Cuscuta europaea TaxID=41803 RepID=A0A9P0Z1U2_CUSEU|nr:unnamed protein product [Cuscuta europaea]
MNCATILEKETADTSARQRHSAFKHDEPPVATCNKVVTGKVAHDLITCVQTRNEDLLSDPSTSDTTPTPKLSCDEIISEDSLFLTLSVSGNKVIPPVDEEFLEGFTQVKRRNNNTVSSKNSSNEDSEHTHVYF